MRVTTPMLFESATQAMLDREADLLRTQQRLSTGLRVLSPSDDPVAASQALGVATARDAIAQYRENVAQSRYALSLAEGALGDVTSVLQSAREILVAAGDGSLSDADRRALAADLRARYDELLATANRRDGQGRHLFAGYREDAQPFVQEGASVRYVGDHGVRSLQVSASRTMAVGASGAAVFDGIPAGNGRFVAAADPGNAGDAAISPGSVADLAALTGDDYTIDFTVVGTTTVYTITDTTRGVIISSGNAYRSGAALLVDGQQVVIQGVPANGDRFTLAAAAPQSLFATLAEAIAALEAPQADAAARGRYTTDRERSLASLDQGLERVLAVRSRFGASLRELDALDAAHAGMALGAESELSRLTSLDYAQAVSDFAREQQALEAAQKAFHGTTRLSLFELI